MIFFMNFWQDFYSSTKEKEETVSKHSEISMLLFQYIVILSFWGEYSVILGKHLLSKVHCRGFINFLKLHFKTVN